MPDQDLNMKDLARISVSKSFDPNKNLFANFYMCRFGRVEDDKDDYCQVWKNRFNCGVVDFIKEMDSLSFEIVMILLRKHKESGF